LEPSTEQSSRSKDLKNHHKGRDLIDEVAADDAIAVTQQIAVPSPTERLPGVAARSIQLWREP